MCDAKLTTPFGVLRVYRAQSFLARAGGLLIRAPLGDTDALLLEPCGSIHTIGMRYAIDAVFLDRAGCVLRVVRDLRPNRLAFCAGARSVLECCSGTAARAGWQSGDCLRMEAA